MRGLSGCQVVKLSSWCGCGLHFGVEAFAGFDVVEVGEVGFEDFDDFGFCYFVVIE